MTAPREQRPEPTEGWGFVDHRTNGRCHYFVDGMSLCRKYGFRRAPVEPDTGKPSPSDCSVCRKKLDARKAATP